MFFTKTANQTAEPQNIHILGTSALGLSLAAELQKIGHRITFICRPQNADEYSATDFIFKDNRKLQTNRQTFNFMFEQTTSPQILFIASEPQFLRSDLLLLSPDKLTNSLITNLTPCEPLALADELLNHQTIPAYFYGWLTKNKNHVSLLGRRNNLTFSLDELSSTAVLLHQVFAGTFFETSATDNNAFNLWRWLAPKALALLLSLAEDVGVFSFIKKNDNRKLIDQYVSELTALAAADGANLNSADILADIYAVPDGYIPTEAIKTEQIMLLAERISALLFRAVTADDQRFPTIRGWLRQIRNKYSITA